MPETWFTTADVAMARERLAANRYGGAEDMFELDDEDITEIIQIVFTATWQRAIAEGRRQATEGWEREWGGRWMQDAVEPTNDVYLCSSETDARALEERSGGYRRAESRLVGPWEPAEQPEPVRELSAVEEARRCATCRHRRDWHEAKTTLGTFRCVGDVGECACMAFVDRAAEQPEGSDR